MTVIPPHFRRCLFAAVLALVGWQIYVAQQVGDGTPSQDVDRTAGRAAPASAGNQGP